MHSWRLFPRCALLCLPVALVATGFVVNGAHDGQATVSSGDRSVSTPLATPTPTAPKAEKAPKAPKADKPKVAAPVVKSEQTVVPAVDVSKPVTKNLVAELPDTSTKDFGMVGVTWSADTKENDFAVTVRTKVNGTWTAWQDMELDDTTSGGRPGTEPLWVGKADGVAVKVLSPKGVKPDDIKVMTIDPGESASDAAPATSTVTSAAYKTDGLIDGTAHATQTADGAPAYTPQPAIILRAAWGARKPTKCDTPIAGDSTHGVVVHHTAGSNSYTQADSAKIVRGDQAYHMDGHGWCDIGYNFIVDKYGQIFEGRSGGIDRQIRAAHSGNGEVNTYAMGVSMAGTFDTVEPSAALKDAMVRLIGWRMGTNYLKAKGTYYVGETITASLRTGAHTMNMIAGHRNVVSTDCPGAKAYAWISASGGLRDRVEDYIANYSSANKTLTAKLGAAATGPLFIGEAPVAGGWRTQFSKLDIYSSTATGAHTVGNTLRTEFNRLGGPGVWLGFPTGEYTGTSMRQVGVQRYTKGSIFKVIPGDGTILTVGMYSPIATRYTELKEEAGPLGWPTSLITQYKVGVTRAKFKNGYIEYTAATGKAIAYSTDGKVITGGTTTPPPPATVPAVPKITKITPTDTKATVYWSAASGATSYGLCFTTSGTSTTCTRSYTGLTGTAATVTNLKPTGGTDYFVTVLAYNAKGHSTSAKVGFNLASSSGTSGSVTPPTAPTGVKVAPTDTKATITWNAVAGATSYGLCLTTSGASTACFRSYNGLTGTAATITTLKPTGGTDYFVSVIAYNSAGHSSSPKLGFDLKPPAAKTVPSKTTGVKVAPTDTKATISWTPATNATSYGLCLKTSGSATSCYRSYTGLAGPAATVTNLKPTGGTDYFVSVLAYNSVGHSTSDQVGFDLVSSTSGANSTTVPSSRTIALAGHGFGHGIGMSQYGAQGAATKGLDYDKILSYYYPGTSMSTKSTNIRVLISKDTDPGVTIKADSGLALRNIKTNAVTKLPATALGKTITQWQIIPKPGATTSSILQYYAGKWLNSTMAAWTGDAQFEASGDPLTLVLPGGSTAQYRNILRSAVPKSGSTDRQTVNVTTLDNYVRGVVSAEMPSSWKPEALKAQSVAARTYGVRSVTGSGYYDICDTTSCQVYGGVAKETAATNTAVAATANKILTYGGTPAFTQFSSSSGGWSAAGSFAYLKAKEDIYDDFAGNGVHNWTASVKASTLEKKYTTIGTLKSLKITQRSGGGDWGGRVSSLTLVGSKASKTVTGNDMRSVLGLRSNWFAFK